MSTTPLLIVRLALVCNVWFKVFVLEMDKIAVSDETKEDVLLGA